jgi:S-(hydroxymethyl)glutathione dehydrogenase/alcohol dehydrogenase
MKTVAAILVETGKPLVVDELEIPKLKSGQVLVEITFSGVCHTQVLECRGFRGEDKFLPHCLGHEGSGVVYDVGSDVTKVKAGDRVILSWIKASGMNVLGTAYQWGQRLVNAGGITTFSRYAVISENRLMPICENISMREAAMLGCAVPTGAGAVLNTAKPQSGQNIAIFGTGGVGLCSVAAASISGCKNIIAVDIQEEKLKIAKNMGATCCINASLKDPVKEIKGICPSGLDFAIEASGRPDVMLAALYSVRSQGGSAVVIGNARYGEKIELDPAQFNQGKRLLGTWGGDSQPDSDYPFFCKMISSGKLNLKPLFSRAYSLNDINKAIDDLAAGKVIRPLIDMTL